MRGMYTIYKNNVSYVIHSLPWREEFWSGKNLCAWITTGRKNTQKSNLIGFAQQQEIYFHYVKLLRLCISY